MLVVSDTSPVSSLLQIGRAELLRDLFQTVCIPPAVHSELARFHPTIPAFIEVREVLDRSRVDLLDSKGTRSGWRRTVSLLVSLPLNGRRLRGLCARGLTLPPLVRMFRDFADRVWFAELRNIGW